MKENNNNGKDPQKTNQTPPPDNAKNSNSPIDVNKNNLDKKAENQANDIKQKAEAQLNEIAKKAQALAQNPEKKPENPENITLAAKPAAKQKDLEQNKKSGQATVWLALLFGIAGTGIGGYSLVQLNQTQQILNSLIGERNQFADKLANINQTVNALSSHIAQSSQGIDQAQVSKMIVNSLQEYAKSQPDKGLSKAEVQALIAETVNNLPSLSNDTTADAVSGQLAEINQTVATAKAQLTSLFDAAQQQTNNEIKAPQKSVLTSLLLNAASAAAMNNYQTASNELKFAQANFSTWHLDSSDFADIKQSIANAAVRLQQLAESNPSVSLANLSQNVSQWPFKKAQTENLLGNDDSNLSSPTTSLSDKLKNAGKSVLNRAFTFTKDDDTGLTWINANQSLQGMVRENVRLDIAYLRNNLMAGDYQNIEATANNLEQKISRYFDSNDQNVQVALKNLEMLPKSAPAIPDLQAIIVQLNQVGK